MSKLTIGRKRIVLTCAVAGTPQQFSSDPLNYPTDFTVYVKTSNAGANVYVGDKTVDNTWIPRAKGSITNFVHGTGNMMGHDEVVGFDMTNFYFTGEANGDQIVVEFMVRAKT